jgi:hypothetical protein
VRSDVRRETVGGSDANLIPEFAPCFRVHACVRLIEQQQFWLLQQRAASEKRYFRPPESDTANCERRAASPERAMKSRFSASEKTSYQVVQCASIPRSKFQ